MIYYPCQKTNQYYDAFKVSKASRISDHPEEPSWGVYNIQTWKEEAVDYVIAVLCDRDVEDAQSRVFTHRGMLYCYEGSEDI